MQFFSKVKNSKTREPIGLFIVLIFGLGIRIWFIIQHPIEQTSDFANLLNFAQILQKNLFAPSEWWHYFVPGMPMLLAGALSLFPFTNPNSVALWETAIFTGLVPLAPYLIWKKVFPWEIRVLSSVLLGACFPQLFFSNILAQDNWVLLPAIMLASLSVRTLIMPGQRFPILAACTYAIAVSIRQDMLIILLPVFLSATIGQLVEVQKIRVAILKSATVLVIIFGFLIVQRGIASGRYTLSSEHLGLTLVGAYAPGAGVGWVLPWEFISREHPEPIPDDQIEQVAKDLAYQEFLKRPGFHFVRMAASVYHYLTNGESLLWWSLPNAASSIPKNLVSFQLLFIHICFLTSVMILIKQRDSLKYTWPLLFIIPLKLGLHAVTVAQARYFLIVLFFELLLISLAVHAVWQKASLRLLTNSLLLRIIIYALVAMLGSFSVDYVLQNTWGITGEEFTMNLPSAITQCKAKNSMLMYITANSVAFKLPTAEPAPKEVAKVTCTAQTQETHQLFLNLKDDYAGNGYPNRIVYIVSSNGKEIFRHDMADGMFTGWIEGIELGELNASSPLIFSVSIQAIDPDKGWGWGSSSSVIFRLDIH